MSSKPLLLVLWGGSLLALCRHARPYRPALKVAVNGSRRLGGHKPEAEQVG